MKEVLLVGLGGGIGAILRYSISMLPIKSEFPWMTLLINFTGAILIGLIMAYSTMHLDVSPSIVLFLKTGVCGGFTTFSTFSLEAVTLVEQHKYGLGCSYIISSILLCLAGVLIGKQIILHL